jgi:hypothetical protein
MVFAIRHGSRGTAIMSGTWKGGATRTLRSDAWPKALLRAQAATGATVAQNASADILGINPLGPVRTSAGVLCVLSKGSLTRTNLHQLEALIYLKPCATEQQAPIFSFADLSQNEGVCIGEFAKDATTLEPKERF